MTEGRKKQWLLTSLSLLISFLFLEVGMQIIERVTNFTQRQSHRFPYFQDQNINPVFERKFINDVPYYTRTEYHPFISSSITFPQLKSIDTYRIFCLGGSAAQGWPHELKYSYPAFLKRYLKQLYPNKQIEVINVAASTYASYRVKAVFDEIIQYQPDLVLIYSGNNEFLERILYPTESIPSFPWNYFATGRIIHKLITSYFSNQRFISFENYQPTFMIDIALGNTSPLKTDPRQLEKVEAHYQYNITQMVHKALESNISVALFTVPTNLKDWIPHASVHQPGIFLQEWQETYRESYGAWINEDYEQAVEGFRSCLHIDTAYAKTYYFLGKSLLELEELDHAKRAFEKAKEWDAYPFRALDSFNQFLRTVSNTSEIPLVDIEYELTRYAKHHIPGSDVLVDHVHPRIESNALIARKVIATLEHAQILPPIDSAQFGSLNAQFIDSTHKSIEHIQHLFLIYRVLLQFDKLEELYSYCKNLPIEVRKSLAYQSLMGQFDDYMEVLRPYTHWLEAHEMGYADSLFTHTQVDSILQDYIQICRESFTYQMSEEEFQQFILH